MKDISIFTMIYFFFFLNQAAIELPWNFFLYLAQTNFVFFRNNVSPGVCVIVSPPLTAYSRFLIWPAREFWLRRFAARRRWSGFLRRRSLHRLSRSLTQLRHSSQLAVSRWQVRRWPMGRLKAAFSLQYRRLVQDEACCQCGRASTVLNKVRPSSLGVRVTLVRSPGPFSALAAHSKRERPIFDNCSSDFTAIGRDSLARNFSHPTRTVLVVSAAGRPAGVVRGLVLICRFAIYSSIGAACVL